MSTPATPAAPSVPPSAAPKCLLGIGGGVAAYKVVTVASRLTQAGWDVQPLLTAAAAQFVTPLTFSAVTNRQARSSMFSGGDTREDIFPHLYPATQAEVFVLAPATADLIARVAHGLGDDLVTTAALSLPASCRRYYCPAMNLEMWGQRVVQENVARLDALGWRRLGPGVGRQACGMSGPGRMLEPEDLVATLLADYRSSGALRGRRLLVVSGPTVEAIDPVRFISNHSSGKMGQALAQAAAAAGATVEFVSGPVPAANLPQALGVQVVPVTSAAEMLAAAAARFPTTDATIYVAAVADYTPAQPADHKLPKASGPLTLELVPTTDIAAALCRQKRPGQICLGFALETDDGLPKAQAKLLKKNLDAIVLNGRDSFGAAEGTFTFIAAGQATAPWGRLDKTQCAARLIAWLAERLGEPSV